MGVSDGGSAGSLHFKSGVGTTMMIRRLWRSSNLSLFDYQDCFTGQPSHPSYFPPFSSSLLDLLSTKHATNPVYSRQKFCKMTENIKEVF
jgi:hypothetical protein